jgi:hypothetical protein
MLNEVSLNVLELDAADHNVDPEEFSRRFEEHFFTRNLPVVVRRAVGHGAAYFDDTHLRQALADLEARCNAPPPLEVVGQDPAGAGAKARDPASRISAPVAFESNEAATAARRVPGFYRNDGCGAAGGMLAMAGGGCGSAIVDLAAFLSLHRHGCSSCARADDDMHTTETGAAHGLFSELIPAGAAPRSTAAVCGNGAIACDPDTAQLLRRGVYLKDWHFAAEWEMQTTRFDPTEPRQNPQRDVSLYTLPQWLSKECDWLNDFCLSPVSPYEMANIDPDGPEVGSSAVLGRDQDSRGGDCADAPDPLYPHSTRFGSGGDYRFVYAGGADTRTRPHVDVCASYSWSLNLSGVKRWAFAHPEDFDSWLTQCVLGGTDFPPTLRPSAAEMTLPTTDVEPGPAPARGGRDTAGSESLKVGDGDERDPSTCDSDDRAPLRPSTVITQYPGDFVFVPALTVHEVYNATRAVSVNHNWYSAASLRWIGRLVAAEARRAAAAVGAEVQTAFGRGTRTHVVVAPTAATSGGESGTATSNDGAIETGADSEQRRRQLRARRLSTRHAGYYRNEWAQLLDRMMFGSSAWCLSAVEALARHCLVRCAADATTAATGGTTATEVEAHNLLDLVEGLKDELW